MSLVPLIPAHSSSANWAPAYEYLNADLSCASVEPVPLIPAYSSRANWAHANEYLNKDPTCASVEPSAFGPSTQQQCKLGTCK